DTKSFQLFDAKAIRMATILGVDVVPSEGHVRACRIDLFEELFDAGKWAHEFQALRQMAGYERIVRR
ncbi:MAG: hypothetical protein J6D34_11975, partial [Atopobiaceae bacterium]|nr:hypothetical protein [Atopobiaceae bacterium]